MLLFKAVPDSPPEPLMRPILYLIAATLLLASPALAAGKAGLWTVTTTWQFSPPFVPSVLAGMARQQGLQSPRNGQPFVHHMCMTPYEADGRQPMHLNNSDFDCVPRVISFRRSLMVMETICHGQVEGVGRSQITWRGGGRGGGAGAGAGGGRGGPARGAAGGS